MPTINLYVFSSKNLTNIWAGIGAGLWAISEQAAANVGGVAQKAKRMRIGAIGIIYCSDVASLTTPFLVTSRPEQDVTVDDVWPERWTLPFRIRPLGTPHNRLHKDRLADLLPGLRAGGRNWSHVFHIQPTTLFVPSEIDDADWEALFTHLVG